MQYSDQRTSIVVFIAVFLAVWGGYLAVYLGKVYFFTMMMAVAGLFAAIVWENIFPDRIDYHHLLVLPVKPRTLYLSKTLTLLVAVAGLSTIFSLFAAAIFTIKLNPRGLSLQYYLGYWLSMLVVDFLANLFMFLLVAVILSILMAIFSVKLFQRISLTFQVLLILGLTSVFIWFPRVYGGGLGLESRLSSFHFYFPPLWFNGLHESIIGHQTSLTFLHTHLAGSALMIALAIYIVGMPLSLSGYLKSSGECKKQIHEVIYPVTSRWQRIVFKWILTDSLERAIYYFPFISLRRSRKHKIRLILIMALPVAFVATYLVILFQKAGVGNNLRLDLPLIAYPYILYYFLVIGVRLVVEQPLNLEANWVFRISQEKNIFQYYQGMRKVVFYRFLLPVTIFFFGVYAVIWKWDMVVLFCAYNLVWGLLLFETSFFKYRKVPFTTEYNPGALNFKLIWPLLIVLFLLYYYLYTFLGYVLLSTPNYALIFFPLIFLILFGFRTSRIHVREEGLIFEEEEYTPIFLDLSKAFPKN